MIDIVDELMRCDVDDWGANTIERTPGSDFLRPRLSSARRGRSVTINPGNLPDHTYCGIGLARCVEIEGGST